MYSDDRYTTNTNLYSLYLRSVLLALLTHQYNLNVCITLYKTFVYICVIFSVTVDLVFVDENNKPIDAVTSSMTLENKDTQEALANSGINVAKVTVPDPIDPADASNSGCKLWYWQSNNSYYY